MSGHHPFSKLTKGFTPERRIRIQAMKDELLAEMPLHELRRARALTQQDLAETLKVNQPAVAKLEQRADIYVSSLRSYIEAVGGRLKIVAEFPEGEVAISNFASLKEENLKMPFEIDIEEPPIGFAETAARANENVEVRYREFTSSEDGQYFIHRLEGSTQDILNRLPYQISPAQIHHMLVVFHRDRKAVVYVNDLQLSVQIRSAGPVETGQYVTKNDISDVERYNLGVTIPDDAGFLFVFSVGWRKGLFYDFGPNRPSVPPRRYDVTKLLAQAYCHVLFQERFSISDDEWTDFFSAKWFPFVGLGNDMIESLLGSMRSGWNPDEELDRIALEVKGRVGHMLNAWRKLPSFSPHMEILQRAVERFQDNDYISCTGLLFPRIEGILRTRHGDVGGTKKPSADNLVDTAVATRIENDKSLLLPHRFAKYLQEVYFAAFNPRDPKTRDIDVSRHSVGHGVAAASRFDQKSAVIGILTVNQLSHFFHE